MQGSLSGLRVLELARYQAGPRAGMILSDFGAEVIKIERPGGEITRGTGPFVDGQSVYFAMYNRGKKSISLDLRSAEGMAIFRDLVPTADIVLENFRPGTMEEMGLDYEALCAMKPDIIMLRVSAFGQYGPHKLQPGFDPIGQSLSGLMSLTGQHEGKPIGTAFSLIDRITALHCTIGALAALRHRDLTGEGQQVDVCLMDSGYSTVEIPMAYYLSTGIEDGEPGREPFRAADGWVIISADKAMQEKLLVIFGLPELTSGTNPLSVLDVANPIRVALIEWCAAHTVDEICEILGATGGVVAPVHTIPQAAADPHLAEREMFVEVENGDGRKMHVPGQPIKLSKTPGDVGPVPIPGEHTADLLGALLGYDDARIAELRAAKVI